MNKKIMLFNILMVMSSQIYTAQVALASLQPTIEALQHNLISISALSAVPVKVPASTVTGLTFWIQFKDMQNALVWNRPYTVTPNSLAAINQVIQNEGGAYIVITPISNLPNWRVSYAVYGAKSLSLIDSQTFELVWNKSGTPVPANQGQQPLAFNIQYQAHAKGNFVELPANVPVNQPTLLQFTT